MCDAEVFAGLEQLYSRPRNSDERTTELVSAQRDDRFSILEMSLEKVKADAIVNIEMLPTSEGGRSGPTPPNQFSCLLQVSGRNFDCRLHLTGSGSLLPGGSATVPVTFLYPEDVLPLLAVGTSITLWDGRVVATGRVISKST